ncbi:kinase-like domain-containing protein [Gymnopilus junonius]|uniref:Kinase-like domain-containing protein n=1 Tax=Gymnopilus junonius TaxID=109634 RepID=A0A9P5TS09_GYMJU|nr:kinase-like domain-containing protein [Gymnopilus junonius]
MYKQQSRLFSSRSGGYDAVWDEHYLALDTLGRYFLANLPRDRPLYEWPKLVRALRQIPLAALWDFCDDVQEEIYRRNNGLRDGIYSLPSYSGMSFGRIYIRRKLCSVPSDHFHALCLHAGFEAGRRCSQLRPMDLVDSDSFYFANAFCNEAESETRSVWELNRSLDNLPDAYSSPQDYDLRGFHFPDASYDHFTATMSVIYSVFVSILQDEERYANLLSCRGHTAQQILDIIQMLLDHPSVRIAAKKSLLAALIRLSGRSGLHPREIWKGRFQGQPVCLKIVKVYQGLSREQMLKDYSREAVLWGHLSHSNILPFYGVYHLNDEFRRICLVSPWMENGNINEYLLTFPSSPRVLLASDVAYGLQYLHRRKLFMATSKGNTAQYSCRQSGRACLADFGLSTQLGLSMLSHSTASIVGGTIRWQAPELLDPEIEDPRPNVESDIYSYGCVLYEIFVGKYPFYECARDVTVILRIIEGKKPSLPAPESISFRDWSLTERLCMLMEDCWSTSPGMRPMLCQIISRLGTQGLLIYALQTTGKIVRPPSFVT